MTEAQDAIARLDASLAEHGTGQIVITRGAVSKTVNARCLAAKADQIVSRSSSAQIIYKGIISSTGLGELGGLRKNDQVLWGGAARAVLWANPISYAGTLVRIDFEMAG